MTFLSKPWDSFSASNPFSFFSQTAAPAFAPRLALMSIMITECGKNIQDGPAKSLVPLCSTCLWGCGKSIIGENNWLWSLEQTNTLYSTFCATCRASLSISTMFNSRATASDDADTFKANQWHVPVPIRRWSHSKVRFNDGAEFCGMPESKAFMEPNWLWLSYRIHFGSAVNI